MLISRNSIAFWLMSIAFIANLVVFFSRLYFSWSYNLHLLAGAWLVISVTLGILVAWAVFGGGRITYHRIVGAVLLYLLIAVTFATLFAFVGLSISGAFLGITFEDDSALASSLFYLSFVTLTSTGFGDIVPVHPIARSLCNIESIFGQLYPATILDPPNRRLCICGLWGGWLHGRFHLIDRRGGPAGDGLGCDQTSAAS